MSEPLREACSKCGRPALVQTLRVTGGFCRHCQPGQPTPKDPSTEIGSQSLGGSFAMLHKKLSDTPPTGDPLTLVFVPSLSALLAGLEKRKGAPLNEEEVFSIRDKAGVIAMRVPDA